MAIGNQLEKSPSPPPARLQPGGRIGGLLGIARVRWAQMASAQRSRFVLAASLVLALAGALTWYALRTDWRTLYVNLDAEEARQMGETLAAAQIPFEPTTDGGGIRVPAEQLDKARLVTAAKGGVKSGRLGFEIFDKPNWVGSEFDEQVNYQRALEGELEHTVGTLSDVESARVHLVLPHDSLFRDQERPAKASVVLKLRKRSLADGEPDAIRNLVASAVDGLAADHVVLVDAAGNVPLGPKTPESMQLSAEQALEDKLVATLEPVTGVGNVRASVTLDYDPKATDETQEIYDPDKTVTLTVQRSEQISGPEALPAGVAGAASNAPNAQALPVYPHQTSAPQSAKTESSTYGVSKTVRHVVASAGSVRRLTAAILVNDRLLQPASGKHAAVWQPRSADELRNLTALAQAAVGFDTSRGDVLTVENLSFAGNAPEPAAAIPERVLSAAEGSPMLIKYGALLIALMVVVIFAVRPAVRHLGAALALREGEKSSSRQLPAASVPAVGLAAPVAQEIDPERQHSQEVFEQVKAHLKREPTQSSRLLQSWIHSD
ncbi:MAG: flagellar basal-body MS-ring/collar protein FliF [Terracidiphilus sp.]